MPLIGNVYVQDSDPGSVGYGYAWAHSDGTWKWRNTGNTAWVTIGNANQGSFGHLPVTGGAMTGAITGNTGWAGADNHDFPTGAKINGVSIATINDVTTKFNELANSITSRVNQAVSASSSSATTAASNIAISKGTKTFTATGQTFQLPTPIFSDGNTPTADQIKWVYGWNKMEWFMPGTGESKVNAYFAESGGTPPLITINVEAGTGGFQGASMQYFVIAVR